MQQENGLDLLPGLRELGEKTDVIIISSASDVNTVQKALHYGVVDYLIKPFQFSRFKEALSHYRQQSQLLAQREFSQADVDSLLRRQPGGRRAKAAEGPDQHHPEHGLRVDRTAARQRILHRQLANAIGISRVSCRKYLIYLAESGILGTRILYGATGRPVYLYQLKPDAIAMLKEHCRPA